MSFHNRKDLKMFIRKKTLESRAFSESNLTVPEMKLLCAQLTRTISLRNGINILSHKLYTPVSSCRVDQIFVDFYTEYRQYPFYKKCISKECFYKVDLQKDGVLTFPWHKDRLFYFMKITHETNFNWKYDNLNHKIICIKPFDIYIVIGGNHSIFCGMFITGGYLPCTEEIDYSPILRELILTPKGFKTVEGNQFVKKSFFMKQNPETEDIFLLGKELIKNNK